MQSQNKKEECVGCAREQEFDIVQEGHTCMEEAVDLRVEHAIKATSEKRNK